MKKLFFTLLLTLPMTSHANCIGSESFKTCYDDSGNTYSVQKYGNSTTVHGSNSRTGSTWNQTSTTIGNSTFTNGTSADGNSWNSTTNRIGNSTFTSGTDSNGNSFSSTCNEFGCY
ncbi:hypothetical protein GCM10007086_46120 [Photobacterium aphoticum]|nr:hypothetical protein C9I90_16530 [Photobacterium aphoticum]GHA67563.1 hypothetical protein GCM10007086_46120 [Photobacterium aphoticum]